MRLHLDRPLAIFDLEATGLNITKERIVQIAILKINPDGSEEKFESLINPEINISDEVTKIHGIKNEDVVTAPTFTQIANKIVSFIENADLAGYNSNKFDIPLLAEELLRAGNNFDISTKKFVDVQNIFHSSKKFWISKNLLVSYKLKNGINYKADNITPAVIQPESALMDLTISTNSQFAFTKIIQNIESEGGVMSATDFRTAIRNAENIDQAKIIFFRAYGRPVDNSMDDIIFAIRSV
jgi:DNA polymerase III alpha subunit (gram-positive type)